MTTTSRERPTRVQTALSREARVPAERLGVSVVRDLVESIVTGHAKPGETLPPEALLASEFAVSRTVIRESIKRVEEKGLIQVGQGRGTTVAPTDNWNLLDPVVLDAMIEHDDSLGILDEVITVRAGLEGEMSAVAAGAVTDQEIAALRRSLDHMHTCTDDLADFRAADVEFHSLIMRISQSRLGASISRILVSAAMESTRYHREDIGSKFFAPTLSEHEAIFSAIQARDPAASLEAMRSHILVAWERRRMPVAGRTTR